MAISLVALKYFRTVATVGSVSRAADILNVAQSAVSRQILTLEEELGTPLLLRHRRGVDLTEAGHLVLLRAEAILRQTSDLHREVAAIDPNPRGALRIGFPPSLSALLVAPIISRVIHTHPSVEISLFEGFSFEVGERVEDDRLDIALSSWLDPNPALQVTPLFSEAIVLAAPADGWPFGDIIRQEDVARLPFMATNFIRRRVNEWLGEDHPPTGRVIETDSQSMLMPLVRLALGHLVVPRSAVEFELRSGTVRCAPLEGLRMTRYLVERKERVRSSAVSFFVEAMDEQLSIFDDQKVLLKVPS